MRLTDHPEFHGVLVGQNKQPVRQGWQQFENRPTVPQIEAFKANNGLLGFCNSTPLDGWYIVVLDFDGESQEADEWADEFIGDSIPVHDVKTRRGIHWYFKTRVEIPRMLGFKSKLDILGVGGYTILWQSPEAYGLDDMPVLPPSAVQSLLEGKQRPKAPTLGNQEGTRNEATRDWLWHILPRFYPQDPGGFEAQAVSYNNTISVPPLEDSELLAMVHYTWGRATNHPDYPFPGVQLVAEIPDTAQLDKLIVSAQELRALQVPPLRQLCGPIHSSSVTLCGGEAGVGKSLFWLHMAAHAASGITLGSWIVENKSRVLYVDGEMSAAFLHPRMDTISFFHAISGLDMVNLDTMANAGVEIDFKGSAWREWLVSVAANYDLIILDTVSSLVAGGEPGDSNQVEWWSAIESMNKKLRHLGCGVVWIDNLNKQGGIVGTSAKGHKADMIIHFEAIKDGQGTGFTLRRSKDRTGLPMSQGEWNFMPGFGWKFTTQGIN